MLAGRTAAGRQGRPDGPLRFSHRLACCEKRGVEAGRVPPKDSLPKGLKLVLVFEGGCSPP